MKAFPDSLKANEYSIQCKSSHADEEHHLINFQDKFIYRRTSIQLIESAIHEGWIKQLAFYHLLKLRYNNSCIYNHKSRMDEIAYQFDLSTKTLYKYFNLLRSKELVLDHHKNLKIKSIRQFLRKRNKRLLWLKDSYNIFDITCLLYCKIIERQARKQAFMVSLRNYEKRRNGRDDRIFYEPCENPFLPSLSYRTISKLIKVSECKAFKIINNLINLGVLKSERQKPQIISKNFKLLNTIKDYPGYRFNIGNNLYEQYGNRIEFLQCPIFLQNISYNQYKKFHKKYQHDSQ
jgi:hypothetical protein